MDQNPDSREAIPPVGLSRMVIGRLEPHFPTSTVRNEEPPVGLSRMIPGESSSPEPPIPISNDSVDSLQVSMQRTRIAPATFVPINFADWADIEPEPIDSTAATHSNRGSNDLLPVTTNIPENEREVDVEGANLQDPVNNINNVKVNDRQHSRSKKSSHRRSDNSSSVSMTNRRPLRYNRDCGNTTTEADYSNENVSSHSDSSASSYYEDNSRKYQTYPSKGRKDNRRSDNHKSHRSDYNELPRTRGDREVGHSSRSHRSRHPSYSDKNAVNYNSDHHRSSNTSRKHGKRESDRHKRKDPKKEYNQDNYYGNMPNEMSMCMPFSSNPYQQYFLQYQNWLMMQRQQFVQTNSMKNLGNPFSANITTSANDRSQLHSGRSSVSEFEKIELVNQLQPNYLANIDENDYKPMPSSHQPSNYYQYQQRSTPVKFADKHSETSFSSIGNLIVCNENHRNSPYVSIIHFKDLLVDDSYRMELEEFPGPLVKGFVHKSTVIEYCENKIRNAHLRKDLNDVDSYILIWEFLTLIIRQNGIMEGTDVSDLLMRNECYDTPKSRGSSKDGKSDTSDKQKRSLTNEEILDKYRDFLIKGDLNKALEWAMNNDLWGHAMYLSSRMEKRAYMMVMSKFENCLTMSDPIQTMYQFMSKKKPAFVTSFVDDKRNEWRRHLAIIISNIAQESEVARDSIISLGDMLMARNNLFAAHFCYLIAGAEFGKYGQEGVKLVLLGASNNNNLPLKEFTSNEAIFMTEIYEYVCQLHSQPLKLANFNSYKFLLATRMIEYGLIEKGMLYFELIAKEICAEESSQSIDLGLAKNILTLATRLQYQVSVIEESNGVNWIQKLEDFISFKQSRQNNQSDFRKIVKNTNSQPVPAIVPQQIPSNSNQNQQYNFSEPSFQPLIKRQQEPFVPPQQQLQPQLQPHQQQLEPQLQPHQQMLLPQPQLGHESIISNQNFSEQIPSQNFQENMIKPTITLPNQNDKPKKSYFDEQELTDKSDSKQDKSQSEKSDKNASRFWPFSFVNKILPKPKNPMILPDDSNKSIVFDQKSKTWKDMNGGGDMDTSSTVKPPPKSASLSNLISPIPNSMNMNMSMNNLNETSYTLPQSNDIQNLPVPMSSPNFAPRNDQMMSTNPYLNNNNIYKSENSRGARKAYIDVFKPQNQKQAAVPNSNYLQNQQQPQPQQQQLAANPSSPGNYFNQVTLNDPISPINMPSESINLFNPPTMNTHSTFISPMNTDQP